MKSWALIVAAGRGRRTGLDINKVFYRTGGPCAVERVLRLFHETGLFSGITVVIAPEDRPLFDALQKPSVTVIPVAGGETRQESVRLGLESLPDDIDLVAIHDAARPFVTKQIISMTLERAGCTGSGVICTKVTDTIRRIGPDPGHSRPLPREELRSVQTPQTFRLREIRKAHRDAERTGFTATDDASLYERFVGPVTLVETEGSEKNRKITFREDLMTQPDFRIGQGYDVHRLVSGRPLILCGTAIPYEKGLDGHSDADVAIHALMDAMLGALALGDIGKHFPDTEERYRGISSLELMKHVNELISSKGWHVSNADLTIVAQRPKLAAYIEEMRTRVSAVLGIDPECVSVKATTTEHLGPEGRGEGISAQAVALISRNSEE